MFYFVKFMKLSSFVFMRIVLCYCHSSHSDYFKSVTGAFGAFSLYGNSVMNFHEMYRI